jgi:purine-nucleoside phosphorylase
MVLIEKLKQTKDYLSTRITEKPLIGMVAGTGLGSVTEVMAVDQAIPYEDIPHFPVSTVSGHEGRIVTGQLSGIPIMGLEGRCHLYEGYSPQEITFPVRVLAALGAEYLFISSAAGGLNPAFESGDLMVVTDHINLTGTNPLVGPNLDAFGPRFPDMSAVYDAHLIEVALEKARLMKIGLHQGVYVGLLGPSLETPAETRFLRMIGSDAVGMSTVSEVIVGVHCGLKIAAIVVITNMNIPDAMTETSLEDVLAAAAHSAPTLGKLWEKIIGSLKP